MKKYFTLLILCFLTITSRAQMGISGAYTWFEANEWELYMDRLIDDYQEGYFFQNAFQVGLDYRLRLKNVRIEFLPEARYARYEAHPESIYDTGTLGFQNFSFHLNTNIYPLNFFGDCDCPTFAKQEPWLEKGLFLQLSPGVHYLVQSYESDQMLAIYDDVEDWAYSLGIGAGFDIGISNWITLTPYGRLTRYWDGKWSDFEKNPFFSETEVLISSYALVQPYALWVPEAGLRLGIRWKH